MRRRRYDCCSSLLCIVLLLCCSAQPPIHHCITQVRRVRCEASGVLVPKDKAIKRFVVRNIVDASAVKDISESCTVDGYALPKVWRRNVGLLWWQLERLLC